MWVTRLQLQSWERSLIESKLLTPSPLRHFRACVTTYAVEKQPTTDIARWLFQRVERPTGQIHLTHIDIGSSRRRFVREFAASFSSTFTEHFSPTTTTMQHSCAIRLFLCLIRHVLSRRVCLGRGRTSQMERSPANTADKKTETVVHVLL